ncbi:unnamed protein product [Acanthoscelides obtectus]|uniref:Uncharacterized protein n=1 Tax=Acanthoscelides obtectus TaxID=200917 RepID=A0A9P0P653_ACAOB|nr:unnamed protein product [Acanthoscelides obtectus]CAK1652020.1 hypothetical protein AOBTE_LOCUS17619 [Acanthoscelides obtectus]
MSTSLSRAQSWPLLSNAAQPDEARNTATKNQAQQLQARRFLCRHYYPEGGWGWVVATCGFLVHFLNHGVQLSCSQLISPAAFKFHVHPGYPAGSKADRKLLMGCRMMVAHIESSRKRWRVKVVIIG